MRKLYGYTKSKMASEFTREDGRELVGCMAFCLRSDGPRRLFGWFNLSDNEKLVLLTMLKKLLGAETELDMDLSIT